MSSRDGSAEDKGEKWKLKTALIRRIQGDEGNKGYDLPDLVKNPSYGDTYL